MKVRTTTFLNIRNAPNTQGAVSGILKPEIEFEVVEKITNGEDVNSDGNSVWYKDATGHYYWSGGISEISNSINDSNFNSYINGIYDGKNLSDNIDYNKILVADDEIKISGGKDVFVGVLDLPIAENISIACVQRFKPTVKPTSNHGNAMATIIAGSGKISGIAPNACIVELQLYDSRGERSSELLNDSLEFIKSHKEKNFIINISHDIPDKPYLEIINELIKLENSIVIAACGTDAQLKNSNLFLPAALPGVISVGSLSQKLSATLNPRVDLIVPELRYVVNTSTPGTYEFANNCSSACAVVSGIAALLISSNKISKFTSDNLLFALKDIAIPLSTINSFTNLNLIKNA